MSELTVQILSPARVVKTLKASQVQLPGVLGYMGILPGHATLVSELGIGELDVLGGEATKEDLFFVCGGYVEVDQNHVKLLVDVIERQDEIDKDRAESAKKRAEKRLAESHKAETDTARAQAALHRAMARLTLSGKKGR